MVMEVLAAVGLASAVVQFVHFTAEIASKGREYHKSADGAIREHIELGEYTENFARLSRRLIDTAFEARVVQEPSAEETALIAVAETCQDVCNDIKHTLGGLVRAGKNRKFESLRHALRAVWNDEKIESSLKKLRQAKEDMIVHILVLINKQQGALERSMLTRFEQLQGDILQALTDSQLQTTSQLEHLSIRTLSPEDYFGPVSEWRTLHAEEIADIESKISAAGEVDYLRHARQMLLDTLYFEQIEDRREAIAKAHAATFQWLFSRQSTVSVPWASFVDWLETEPNHNIYWITGKPGSGKSTLMRYLAETRQTKKHLTIWAKPQPLLIASCFFWHSGDIIQKSQQGLLRSLLFQLITQSPRLAEFACPWRLRSYLSGALNLGAWTTQQLLTALNLALKNASTFSKICLFIDGLDEYDGDDAARSNLVDLVKGFSQLSYVKVCVSSRPWVIFRDAFESGPSLELHQLTSGDIRNYVTSELATRPAFGSLEKKNPDACSQLVQDIADKAQGVFLWVYLVVRDLLQCLLNRDGIHDIQRKLQRIPSDLNDYFATILDRLDSFYFEQACQLFQVAMTADRPLSLLTYSYVLDKDEIDPVAMKLIAASTEEINQRCDDMDWRLNSRCRGLLEVVKLGRVYPPTCEKGVGFLHRTVKDYFATGVLEQMKQKTLRRPHDQSEFEVNSALAGSFLAQLKAMDFHNLDRKYIEDLVIDLCKFARQYEQVTGGSLTSILDSMDYTCADFFMNDSFAAEDVHWSELMDLSGLTTTRDPHSTFLSFALDFGLREYFRTKTLSCPQLIAEKRGMTYLDYIVRKRRNLRAQNLDERVWTKSDSLTLDLILSNGPGPNEIIGQSTVWSQYLQLLYGKRLNDTMRIANVEIVRQFINHGARMDLRISKTALDSQDDYRRLNARNSSHFDDGELDGDEDAEVGRDLPFKERVGSILTEKRAREMELWPPRIWTQKSTLSLDTKALVSSQRRPSFTFREEQETSSAGDILTAIFGKATSQELEDECKKQGGSWS